MLRCNEVTRLYASDAIHEASPWTRLTARLHLLMCRSCRRYVRELRAIGEAVRGLARQPPREANHDDAIIRSVLPDPPRDDP